MKTLFKRGLYIFSISALVSIMTSCLGNGGETDTYPVTDAELLAFWLYHTDSIPELSDVAFTIDHNGSSVGMIYNKDSMAYNTILPEKVFIGYISGSGFDNVLNITNGDSIWLKQGDSIDITVPQTLQVHALDGKTKKLYIAQLNIHQVNPDSIQYHQLVTDLPFLKCEDTKTLLFNNRFLTYSKIENKVQLNTSSDAVNWTNEGESGLPDNTVINGIQSSGSTLFAYTEDGDLYFRNDPTNDQWVLANKPFSIKIKSILGYLNAGPKQKEGLCLVIEIGGKNTFAFTNDFLQWEYDSAVPVADDFPLYEFSSCSHQIMLTERITIFGGISSEGTIRNAAWSTETGRYWAKLTANVNVFPLMKGANTFYYDNEFWMINGETDNDFNENTYYSTDGGVTWRKKMYKYIDDYTGDTVEDFLYAFPEDYTLRYGASLVIDKDNKYFYIIGGKQNDGASLSDVWKGFLNKKEFKQ